MEYKTPNVKYAIVKRQWTLCWEFFSGKINDEGNRGCSDI